VITMNENMCGGVNTRCLQNIASKCLVYQTNFKFFYQAKIRSTSCSRHAQIFNKCQDIGLSLKLPILNKIVTLVIWET